MSQLFLPLLYREKKTVLPDEKSCSHAAFQYAFKSADSVYRDEQKENMERNKEYWWKNIAPTLAAQVVKCRCYVGCVACQECVQRSVAH